MQFVTFARKGKWAWHRASKQHSTTLSFKDARSSFHSCCTQGCFASRVEANRVGKGVCVWVGCLVRLKSGNIYLAPWRVVCFQGCAVMWRMWYFRSASASQQVQFLLPLHYCPLSFYAALCSSRSGRFPIPSQMWTHCVELATLLETLSNLLWWHVQLHAYIYIRKLCSSAAAYWDEECSRRG